MILLTELWLRSALDPVAIVMALVEREPVPLSLSKEHPHWQKAMPTSGYPSIYAPWDESHRSCE